MERLIYTCLVLTLLSLSLQVRGQSANDEIKRQFKANIEPLYNKMVHYNTLNYGDTCSSETEQNRQRITQQIYDSKALIADPAVSLTSYHSSMYTILTSLANLPGQLCNTYKGLACSSKGQCTCGAGHNYLENNLKYDSELENGKCVLAEGSFCAPNETLNDSQLFNQPRTEHSCTTTAPCRIKSSGKLCEQWRVNLAMKDMVNNAGKEGQYEILEFILRTYRDGVCICTGSGSGLVVISQNLMIFGFGVWVIFAKFVS